MRASDSSLNATVRLGALAIESRAPDPWLRRVPAVHGDGHFREWRNENPALAGLGAFLAVTGLFAGPEKAAKLAPLVVGGLVGRPPK